MMKRTAAKIAGGAAIPPAARARKRKDKAGAPPAGPAVSSTASTPIVASSDVLEASWMADRHGLNLSVALSGATPPHPASASDPPFADHERSSTADPSGAAVQLDGLEVPAIRIASKRAKGSGTTARAKRDQKGPQKKASGLAKSKAASSDACPLGEVGGSTSSSAGGLGKGAANGR